MTLARLLDGSGVNPDLRIAVLALIDWTQQPEIVEAVVAQGRASRTDLGEMYLALNTYKDQLGQGHDAEWWDEYERKVMQSFHAFIQDRNTRRLIAKHMKQSRKIPAAQTLKELTALKEAMEG